MRGAPALRPAETNEGPARVAAGGRVGGYSLAVPLMSSEVTWESVET